MNALSRVSSRSLLLVRHSNKSNKLGSIRTKTTFLTPEEKRKIFREKSKQLHETMEGVLGEKSAAKETVATATATQQPKQRRLQQPSSPSSSSSTSRQERYNQAIINFGVSFFVVVLAAQSLKSASAKRKAEINLEAALELLEEKRSLLSSVQDQEQLRALAKQCVAQVRSNDGVATTIKRSTGASSSSSSSISWGLSSLFGSKPSVDFDNDETETAPTSLEEEIFQILSNHVHQVVGDAAFTEEERDKYHLEQLAAPATGRRDSINIARKRTEKILEDEIHSTAEAMLQTDAAEGNSEKLLQELLEEEQNNSFQVEKDANGTTVIKKRVFQI